MKVNKLTIEAALGVSEKTIRRYASKPSWPKGTPTGPQKALEWDVNELPEVIELTTKTVEVRQLVIDYLLSEGFSASQILGTPEPESLEDDPDWIAAHAIPLPEIPKPPQVSHEEVEALEEKMMRSKSKAARDKARKRGQVCRDVLNLIRQGHTRTEAIKKLAGPGQSIRAINAWLAKVKGQKPHYFDALLFKDYPTEKPVKKPFDRVAKMKLCALYFRPEKPSKAASYRIIKDLAEVNDWQIPGQKMAERFLAKEEKKPENYLARYGKEALERKMPHMKRTKDHLYALDIVEADGHTLDLMVKFPSGKVGRPILIAWMDEKSSKILSYRVAETENQHVIRESFAEVLKNHGIPKHVYIDNGRAFANKVMSGGTPHRYRFKVKEDDFKGLFALVNTQVTWARPYHGQSKTIERAWNTLVGDIAKHPDAAGAYTGNNPTNKPSNYGERALEWEKLLEIVEQGIICYNSQPDRKGAGTEGRSFDQIFSDSKPSSIDVPTKTQLLMWSLMAKKVKVKASSGSIAINGRNYWPKETLGLADYEGKEIVVRYDHHDPLADVYFETVDGINIGMGYTFESEFDNRQGAEQIEKLRNSEFKKANQKLKEAHKALATEEIKPTPKRKAAPLPEHQIVAHDFKNNKTKQRVQEPKNEEESGFSDFDRSILTLMAKEKKFKQAL